MKKFFSTVWSVLRYILIYAGCSILIGIFGGIYFAVKYNLDKDKIAQAVQNNAVQLTGLISLFSLIFFLLVVKFCHKSIIGFLQFKKLSSTDCFYCIGITAAFAFFSMSLINLVINIFPEYEEVSQTVQTAFNPVGIPLIIVLIPIFEEIFFRGIIFNELRSRINVTAAVILQALIFGVFHGNILQGIYTFMLAIILALVYIWTRSIWSNIIVHITYNLLGSIVIPIIMYLTQFFIIGYLVIGGALTVFLIRRMYMRAKLLQRENAFINPVEESYNSNLN
ncbi:MAG: type II CAAX endopeptidase family protein [Bacillota bacterium]|nr:type II CAAX endopeptidase family protein [Bacillota bacterium]